MPSLKGVKVAILVDDGFEQVELTGPRKALDVAMAESQVVSPKPDQVRAWSFTDWGDKFPVDVPLARANPNDFDALLLPGGVMNPDSLRMQPRAVQFVKAFFDAGKPVAVICHGPWTVIEAGAARGALAQDRPQERRRGVDRRRGRGGRQPRVEPQARRPPGLQPRDGDPLRAGADAGRPTGLSRRQRTWSASMSRRTRRPRTRSML